MDRFEHARFDMLEAFNMDTSCLSGASFRHRLFLAISHADGQNLGLLAKGFPLEVATYQAYVHGRDVQELYLRMAVEA